MWEFVLVIYTILGLFTENKIPFYQEDGLIYIDVFVDGKSQQFLLDTGCSDVLVNGHVKKSDVILESVYGEMPSKLTKLSSVQLGNELLLDLIGLTTDLSGLQREKEDINGILGMSFIDDHILYINYARGNISFLDSGEKQTLLTQHQVFRFPIEKGLDGTPLVEIESNGEKLMFLLDTGANVHAVKDDFAPLVGEHIRLINNKKMITIPTNANANKFTSIYTISSENGWSNSSFHGILSIYQLGFDKVILDFKNDELILIK